MRMEAIDGLRVRLQRRWRAVQGASTSSVTRRLGLFERFVRSDPVCTAIMNGLVGGQPDLEAGAQALLNGEGTSELTSEEQFAALGWFVLVKLAATTNAGQLAQTCLNVSYHDDPHETHGHQETVTHLLESYVEPFYDFIDEQLGDQADALSELVRFQQWAEWFGQERIRDVIRAEEARAMGTGGKRRIELVLKSLLFEWMYNDGLSLTRCWREPETVDGQPDFVVVPNFDFRGRPIAVEVKLFGDGYGKAELSKGLGQLSSYMQKHACESGYLVVFNRDPRGLALDLLGRDGVPHLLAGHRTAYVLVIDATGDPTPPSKRGGYNPVVIVAADLHYRTE